MIKFIIYLLESSAILALFYLLYVAVMKKETFFELNRFFLLGIVVFSLLFPLMSFDFSQGKIAVVDAPVQEISEFRTSYHEAMSSWEFNEQNLPNLDNSSSQTIKETELAPIEWGTILLNLLIGVYAIGIIFCLSKMFLTIRWLGKTIKINPKVEIGGICVVKMPNPIAPFSFLNYAFVHHEIIDTPELDQIIAHEKAHIQQRHSLDLIFIQFLAAFLWFNPLIWMLIKSLKTTHEYIADKKIIKSGYSLVEYQTLLLSQLISNNSYGLVHNFNLSFIKKRITMMKNNKSGLKGKVRVALSIACAVILSLVIVQCNTKLDKEALAKSEMDALLEKYISDKKVEVIYFEEGEKYKVVGSDTVWRTPELTISNDQILVDGIQKEISDIEAHVKNIPAHGLVILKIDRNQQMKKVKEVQMELRRLNKRKIVYEGYTASGKQRIQPFLFAPLHWAIPNSDALAPKIDFENASLDGNVTTLNGVEYLNINLSETGKVDYREDVYDFVYGHVKRGSVSYVIKAEFDENDVFENYLTNLANVFQAFDKVYQSHAYETYGSDYKKLNSDEKLEVANATPKAVFIAES